MKYVIIAISVLLFSSSANAFQYIKSSVSRIDTRVTDYWVPINIARKAVDGNQLECIKNYNDESYRNLISSINATARGSQQSVDQSQNLYGSFLSGEISFDNYYAAANNNYNCDGKGNDYKGESHHDFSDVYQSLTINFGLNHIFALTDSTVLALDTRVSTGYHSKALQVSPYFKLGGTLYHSFTEAISMKVSVSPHIIAGGAITETPLVVVDEFGTREFSYATARSFEEWKGTLDSKVKNRNGSVSIQFSYAF